MKFYLILHVPSTVWQQPTCHFRNIEVESTDDRHLESFDALGPGRWILKKNELPLVTAKRWQTIVPYFSQILTNFSLNLCNNSDQTWFSNTLTFARSLGRCWKPRPTASVFNISLGTWQTLMHGKPCLIPIIKHCFSCINVCQVPREVLKPRPRFSTTPEGPGKH